ncbi:MAG TPA: Gfo/Idh/MocA family oxidoreductase [Pirellulaceae bacterium]|nr:Gfo/Idh/MocA family oxidoreductase [Pirellulaceae bacterium]HMO92398.1 Gfo/Idh/MocA family oxidoreductase [Pirellulaceae bacterium]HMP69517.1 Gfo/Idh/MocA family oxidoreductase [Pirellulaceae bacterium]
MRNVLDSRLDRRSFLAGIAAASAATMCRPQISMAAGYRSRSDRPVFATVGLRNQGWFITQKFMPYADLAALVDVDQTVLGDNIRKATEGQSREPQGYEDYRQVLKRADIDAILIATPDHWHAKIAIEALLAGKDVYCEKPLTLTVAEGKLIEKVVEQTGRVFQVGTQQRTESDQFFLQAIALVREGRIGDIKKITCGINSFSDSPPIPVADVPAGLNWDFWLGPAPKVDYRALPEIREGYGGGVPLYSNCHYSFRQWHEYSGGKLTDWGAHHVDIAYWAIEHLIQETTRPIRVTPLEFVLPVEYRNGYPTVDDQYNVATKHVIRVDLPGDIELVITSEGDNGIMFEGTRGRFFVNRGKLVGRPVEDLQENPLPSGTIEEVYGGPVSADHLANFAESIKTRQQPISDVWSHNRMLEICHLSNIAMRLNRPLEWDLQKREIIADDQASSFLSRECRQGYEIEM